MSDTPIFRAQSVSPDVPQYDLVKDDRELLYIQHDILMIDAGPHRLWEPAAADWQYHVSYMAYWYDCAQMLTRENTPEEWDAWPGGYGFAFLAYRDGTFALVDIEHQGNNAVIGKFDHTHRLTLERVKEIMAGSPIGAEDWGYEEGSAMPVAYTPERLGEVFDYMGALGLPTPTQQDMVAMIKEPDMELRSFYTKKILPLYKAQHGQGEYAPSSAIFALKPEEGEKSLVR